MTREQQNQLSSEQLKSRWSDPVWRQNQIEKLKQGAKNRPPRSEESKSMVLFIFGLIANTKDFTLAAVGVV